MALIPVNVSCFRNRRQQLMLPLVVIFLLPSWSPLKAQEPAGNGRQRSSGAQNARQQYPPVIPGAQEYVYKEVAGAQLKAWVFPPMASAIQGSPPRPSSTETQSDSGRDLKPAVVFFFGGGWTSGSPQQFVPHCEYLSRRGIVAITCDYRVASRHQIKAVACVEDAKSAIRWVRANAKTLGVDAGRICAAGGSAGGHLAACTALLTRFDSATEDPSISSVPNALALFNPALVLAPWPGLTRTEATASRLESLEARLGVSPEALSPIHHIKTGAPPTIIFHGEEDTTVPLETAKVFTAAMQAAGNRCELVSYPDAAHGFFNLRGSESTVGTRTAAADNQIQWFRRTTRRLDQFLGSLNWIDSPSTMQVVDQDHVRLRGRLSNSGRRFLHDQAGHVAFLGGSITEMNGYRPRVESWLSQQFPKTQFTFTNAGISSTCSWTGAFRLQRDVLSQGPVDLLFVEFAVNDDQDAHHTADGCIQGMEGIIRHVRRHNPAADIVMVHFVNPDMLATIQSGQEPLSSGQHELVARYEGVSSVYLSREVADRIAAEELTWEQFGGTHPGPLGNQLAADLIADLLTTAWQEDIRQAGAAADDLREPHPSPNAPLLTSAFDQGALLPHSAAVIVQGWATGVPDWKQIAGSQRERFSREELLTADQPGAELTLNFTGRAVGAWVLAGPDAGQVEARIDGGAWKTIELYHSYSRQLHYPRTVMFESALPPGPHRLELRVGSQHHPDSTGHAARVLSLVVNQ